MPNLLLLSCDRRQCGHMTSEDQYISPAKKSALFSVHANCVRYIIVIDSNIIVV